MKFENNTKAALECCRTPHGVRGLKSPTVTFRCPRNVAPLTGCVD